MKAFQELSQTIEGASAMHSEDELTNSPVNGSSKDEPPEFEVDDTFMPVLPADESDGDNDEIGGENADDLITPFKLDNSSAGVEKDETQYYLQQIARTPLLTRNEELEHFGRFDAGRQRVAELFD